MEQGERPSGILPTATSSTLLALEQITQRFGSLVALDNVSFTVRAGEVHALLGENGAGKTTLMRIAFGLLKPDSGTLRWRGTPLEIESPADALAAGIGMVHQHFTLVPAMTVAENVALGGHGRYTPAEAIKLVHDVSRRTGLSLDATARVDSLSVGAQQRAEIVKALARNVQLLILDEPTAVLAPAEAQEVLTWVREFANSGNAVVLITHKLRDALAISNRITVLRGGKHILTALATQTTETELGEAMMGDSTTVSSMLIEREQSTSERTVASTADSIAALITASNATSSETSNVVLSAIGVSFTDSHGITRLHETTIEVKQGEIVGVAAIEGAGQRELLRILAQRLKPSRGTVHCAANVGFVPEDRLHDALLTDASLFENVALHGAGTRRGFMRWKTFRDRTSALLERFDVRARNVYEPARTLSGGNQQKFVLGRELMGSELTNWPQALIVENPSRGLDFNATAAIHNELRNARNNGCAVVLYSSDLDEVLLLADRVVVMCEGHMITLTPPFTREEAGSAMLGAQYA